MYINYSIHLKKVLYTIVLLISITTFVSTWPLHAQNVRATYAGLNLRATVTAADINDLVTEIEFSNSNTYLYLMGRFDDSHWNLLPNLLNQCDAIGVNVWVYLVPPTEPPLPRPFLGDYVEWAEEIARLSLTHNNLTAFAIDDFDGANATTNNLVDTFTPAYVETMINAADLINSDLAFVPVAYYRASLLRNATTFNQYRPFIDAILFPYILLDGPDNIYETDEFLQQINEIKGILAAQNGEDRIPLIIDVYATNYMNMHSEPEYVQEIAEKAYLNTDGVCIYRLQTGFRAGDEEHLDKRNLTRTLFDRWRTTVTGNKQLLYLAEQINTTWRINAGVREHEDYLYASTWRDFTNLHNFVDHQFDIAGDFDGDDLDEIAIFYDYPNGTQRIFGYEVTNDADGNNEYFIENMGGGASGNSWYSTTINTFNFDCVDFAVPGDFDNDGTDEIALFYDYPNGTQRIFGFGYNTTTMRMDNIIGTDNNSWFSTNNNIFDFDCIQYVLSGDFDADGGNELAIFYDYAGSGSNVHQRIFIFDRGNTLNKFINTNGPMDENAWFDLTEDYHSFDDHTCGIVGDFYTEQDEDRWNRTNPRDEMAFFYAENSSFLNKSTFINEGSYIIEKTNETKKEPDNFVLISNYPNPFNPTTTIHYMLPHSAHVVLNIYNVNGQEITTLVNDLKTTGNYSVVWDGKDRFGNKVPSRLYFYQLKAGAFHKTNKMMLFK